MNGAEAQTHADAVVVGTHHRVRRTIAAILAVLSGLFVAVGVTSVWVHKTTYQTDSWMATVGPLANDARVQAALSDWTNTQISEAVDTQAFFTDLLPPRAQPLAAPLATAVNSFVAQATQRFFASPAFSKIWLVANRDAHAGIVRVLQGKHALKVRDGKVQLDLLPMIDEVLQKVNERTDGRFAGKIESITNLTPDQARAKLSQALGRPLPADFGTITVFEKQKLSSVQRAAQVFEDLVYVIVAAALALIALAFLVAPDRRRIAIWIGLSAAVFLVAFRATARASGSQIVGTVIPQYRDATQAVVSRVLASYLDASLVSLLFFLIVALVAFLAGPSRTAVAVRHKVTDMRWLSAHAGAMQLGVLAVALVWVLVTSLTFGKLLLALLIVATLEVVLWRLRSLNVEKSQLTLGG